ncbi:PD-(D/E)XK motif protein [Amycolatopsis sp. PS_44_ISF1]|uniref:PD-(D/E)XK motif protein n=1 Tax=Amycolatopsis sp. PS_44_ISF1 TaxID=2974917 RepID=UPI0028DE8A62|nr:PD-(D/E)XK motif protein [Amycolatopsis sp. PS_44_ISF1]MDT8910554.1 PD-(D/E)XK motif protein [Amycolatopsis sp. PS_44_ISF1]
MAATLRKVVDDHWTMLEEEPTSGPRHVRTSELPVTTPLGPVLAAMDHEGLRHLLVPLSADQGIRRNYDGAALTLRERPLENGEVYERYADLGCVRRDLDEVFTGLVADVLAAVAEASERPLKALYNVLNRWRALFQPSPAPLSADGLAGLFGELVVLNHLLEGESTAIDFWTGPSGHRHDFTVGARGIEVKTSTAPKDRKVRIHGVEQLQPPPHGDLDLVWIRLEPVVERGRTIGDLVEAARKAGDDETGLLFKLAEAGYRPVDADLYRDKHFVIREERWYEVDAGFPRVEPSSAPPGVTDLDYTIDLDRQRPQTTETHGIRDRIVRITQENK